MRQRKPTAQSRHIEALVRIFPAMADDTERKIAALVALEKRAHRYAERLCNVNIPEVEQERTERSLRADVAAILGSDGPVGSVFINLDPRGAAIKLSDAWVRGNADLCAGLACDWGGYGMIAAEW